MRALTALPLTMLLAACASPLPPHDPGQAWIELDPLPGQWLMADELDHRDLSDGRYFQVSPGAHELVVRHQFERPGGGSLQDPGGGPVQVTCHLQLRYDGFVAGQRYRIDARPIAGYRAQAWLRDDRGQVLARARVLRCGAF